MTDTQDIHEPLSIPSLALLTRELAVASSILDRLDEFATQQELSPQDAEAMAIRVLETCLSKIDSALDLRDPERTKSWHERVLEHWTAALPTIFELVSRRTEQPVPHAVTGTGLFAYPYHGTWIDSNDPRWLAEEFEAFYEATKRPPGEPLVTEPPRA